MSLQLRMLRVYRHRVNSITELDATPLELGIEFDLRSEGQRIIVTHDPFTEGPSIEEFFPRIGARPCIFNVKCEGIEARVAELAAQHAISDYFFLDCSVPAAVKLWCHGERRFAVRFSEHEPVEGVLAWAGKADWCWIDCFTHFPGDLSTWTTLASYFKICLVSPELQGHGAKAIQEFREGLAGRPFVAVCTKRPDLWLSLP